MKITLEQAGKRFQKYWIFRDVSYTFEAGQTYALLGANGSGKSTLLRAIAGIQALSSGKVTFTGNSGEVIPNNEVYRSISFCAPGMELVEELTLTEFLNFHFSFKKIIPGYDTTRLIDLTGLANARDKPIGDYSSGMKQRVKLIQAMCSDTPILLLDEPCTNLDNAGVEQYFEWIELFAKNRLVIVASNDAREYQFCSEKLQMSDFK